MFNSVETRYTATQDPLYAPYVTNTRTTQGSASGFVNTLGACAKNAALNLPNMHYQNVSNVPAANYEGTSEYGAGFSYYLGKISGQHYVYFYANGSTIATNPNWVPAIDQYPTSASINIDGFQLTDIKRMWVPGWLTDPTYTNSSSETVTVTFTPRP
jgi:hypothetical protein